MKELIVIALLVALGCAELDKAFKEKMLKDIEDDLIECSKKEMTTKEDMDDFGNTGPMTRRGAKCLAACLNEREELQDKNGKLNLDGALRSIEPFKSADADIYSKLKQVMTKCVEKVGDPGDRCETAAKFFECNDIVSAEVGIPPDFLDV